VTGGAFQRWRLSLLAAGACVAIAAPAQAAPRDFHVAAKPLPEALVDFAVQAGVSINSGAAYGCRRLGNAVSGRMEPQEALRRILAGTGCGFQMIDARTVRIVQLPKPAPSQTAPRPAPAQPPTVTEVEGVIVTATRRPSVASRLPDAVSAVSGVVLDRSGARDLNAVALLTPGLTVTNLGPGRDKLIVRGLSDGALTGRVQSTVGIYLDDTRLTYSAPDPDLRLADVDRVEVLRGPQGSLYGAGSIGGVLHIVSRQPELGAFSARLSTEGSLTADGGAGYALEAMVNAPLSERAAVRVVAYRETAPGYIDDVTLGTDDINRTTRQGVRATARLQLTPDWALSAGLVRQTIDAEDSQYVQAGLPDLVRSNRVAEPHENDFGDVFLTLTGDTDYGRLRWTTALLNHRLTSRYDASTALPAFGAPLGPPAAYDERFASRTVVSELTLISPIGARIPWLFGAFYADGHEDQDSRLSDPAELYTEVRNDEVGEAAVYGEASLPWGPWTLTVGGRYFRASVETESEVEAPGLGSRSFEGDFTESGFAPKVVLRYQLSDRWMVYGQAAEGYRTGGFNTGGPIGQVFAAPGVAAQPARRYGGDELWSYEAGSKWTDPARGLTLQGAVFLVGWRNIQSTQLLPSGAPYTANIGDGRALGGEIEAAWSIGEFDFTGNLLLNRPQLDDPGAGFPGAEDSPLAGVARFTAGLTAHYRHPFGDGLALTADASLAYVGPSRLSFDASIAPPMGDYAVGRVAAGFETGRWRLGAYVDNVANDRGNTFAYGNPFTLRDTPQKTPLRPRTFGLRLAWTY